MALSLQIPMINVFILLITCNADSTIENSNMSFDHASIKTSVKPLSYDLMIHLPLEDSLIFYATSTNLIIIENPTRKIDLKVDGLRITISSLQLRRYPYMDKYVFQDYYYSNETETLSLDLDDDVPSGFYNMFIEFTRDIFENEIQIYTTSCEDCDRTARLIFTMQLERNGARQIFPYWDEEASRARIGIATRHLQKFTAVSSMPIMHSTVRQSMKETIFFATSPVPILLGALSIANFVCSIKGGRSFIIRMCSISLDEMQTTFAFNTSAAVVSYMIQYTKILPPFLEIAITGLPDTIYQHVKNWGFYMYREDDLIYNASLHPIDRKLDVSMIVGSLTAFQWFNRLVSPTLWTHVWFCQTLALFYGAKAFAETYHDEDVSFLFTYRLRSLARENYTVRQIKPTWYGYNSEDVHKLNASDNRHVFLTSHVTNCLKEYAVMVMLETAVTESVFRKATISYLKKHQFSTATPNDFWDALQDTVDERTDFHGFPRIAHLMQNWLMEESLPVVTVTFNGEKFTIKIKDVHAEHNNNSNYLWIPINYVMKSEPEHVSSTVWMQYGEQIDVFAIHPFDWIVVNWQHAGYYRVGYDVKLLERFFLSIRNCTNIDVLSRAHIIEDAYYFWTKKELNISMFNNLIRYISDEEQCAPWYAVQKIMQKMWTFFKMESGISTYDHIQRIFKKLLQKIGYTEHPDDTDCVKFKRFLAMKWTCRFYDHQCLDIAKKRMINNLKNPEKNVILPMWEEWTYCNGLVFSNEFIWNTALIEFSKTENKKILTYLVCSEDIPIILKYFDLVISEEPSILNLFRVSSEDRQKIYRAIVQKHGWKDEVMDYILNKTMEMKTNDVSLLETLSYIIENVYSSRQINKIASILLELYDTDVISNSQVYESFLNKIQDQISLVKKLEELAEE